MRRLSGLTLVAGLVAVVAATSMSSHVALHSNAPAPGTLSLTDANCPVCEGDVLNRLETARKHSMDIEGKDMYGEVISHFGAHHKWVPFPESDRKQTVCGELYNFDYNEGDKDWEFDIKPHGPYAQMLARAKLVPMLPPVTPKQCGGDECIHAEINPDFDFPTNDLFKIDFDNPTYDYMTFQGVTYRYNENFPATADVEKDSICVYGPWIRDDNHDNKPEIHPAELTWWRVNRTVRQRLEFGTTNQQNYHVMMIQDDRGGSNFDSAADFHNYPCQFTPDLSGFDIFELVGEVLSELDECLNPPPFRPWATYPRRSRVQLAFEVSTNGVDVRDYAIKERHAHHVTTASDAAASADEGSGAEHKIEYNGKVVLTVREVDNDSHLGVTFPIYCRDAVTNKLRGFISINSKYGTSNSGGEGFHVLDISQADVNLVAGKRHSDAAPGISQAQLEFLRQLQNIQPIRPHTRFAFTGLRRVNNALVADGGIIIGESRTNAAPISATGARRGAQALAVSGDTIRMDGDTVVRIVRDIPIAEPSVIDVQLSDGSRIRLSPPRLGISTGRRETRAIQGRFERNWTPFISVTGGRGIIRRAPGRLVHAHEWVGTISPRYLGVGEDSIAEDETTLSRPWNVSVDSALRDTTDNKVRALYGTTTPFKVQWRFRAVNLLTGREAAISHGKSGEAARVVIDTSHHAAARISFKVSFPATTDSVYKLEATARVTDVYGFTGEVHHVVWSHYVSIPDAKRNAQLLRMAAGMSGVDLLRASADTTPSGNSQDARTKVARQQGASRVVAAVRHSGADGVLTVDEMLTIIQAARSLRVLRQ